MGKYGALGMGDVVLYSFDQPITLRKYMCVRACTAPHTHKCTMSSKIRSKNEVKEEECNHIYQ